MNSQKNPKRSLICAIVCVRNERRYLEGLIQHLRGQGVDIAFIDNDSTDGSRELIERYVGTNVLSIHHLPFDGAFSLSAQLQAKAEVERTLPHEWVMHVDADEIHHPAEDGVRLTDIAKRASATGFNAVNFEEFVFLPPPGQDLSYDQAHLDIRMYYYFAPTFQRLIRLYKRGEGLDNRAAGGHRLKGGPKIYPQNQVLRHYIGLDQEHLFKKYIGRVFDEAELKKGWHGNRVGLTKEMLSLDRFDPKVFNYLPSADSRRFLRNMRRTRHFWKWPITQPAASNTQKQHAARGSVGVVPPPTSQASAIVARDRQINALKEEIGKIRRRQNDRRLVLESQVDRLKERNQSLRQELVALRQSLPWRLTAPFRAIAAFFRP